MSTLESSLPDAWVERIWATMRGFYGATFDRQWECPAGLDPVKHVTDLKAIWGRELRGFQQNPKAIAYGLDNLAEFPPNLPQFIAICKRAPMFAPKELPWPKADPVVVAKALEGFKPQLNGDRAWIARLQRRVDSGATVSIAVRQMLKNAQQATGAST